MICTVLMYIATATRPGMKAAMNRRPISCWVMMPYTASTTDGGMRMPSVPPAAITPVEMLLL